MVKRYYSFMIAAVLMLMVPFAMAGGSGHEGLGVEPVYQLSAIDVMSVNALDVDVDPTDTIQNSVLFQSAIAYKSPKEHEIHRKPTNNGKAIDNVLVTAYPGRYLYSGVTAA